MKKEFKIIILVLISIFIVIFRFNLRYFIDGGGKAIIASPDAFYFDFATGKNIGEVYYLTNKPYDDTASEDGYDESTNTYHLFVDSSYIDNDDAYLYISGNYWNCPYKPIIKIDGNIIDDDLISISNDGYADGIFSEIYISKVYHISYYNRIYSERIYEFYVRCNDYSESIRVVFHEI